MINLIPIEEKKEIKKYFFYRFFIVSFVMFCFSIFVLLIAILPAYILSFEKKVSIGKKLEIQKSEVMPEIDQRAQASIKDLNDKLKLLENAKKNKYVFSKNVIDEIISQKVSGIKINKFSYENNSIEDKKINIGGIAENREQLLLFRKALENDASFKKIDLPISNFVKGSNINFNLDIVSL